MFLKFSGNVEVVVADLITICIQEFLKGFLSVSAQYVTV